MEPARDPALRPLADVLGGGTVAGAIAGLAAGAIDALWSWGPAGAVRARVPRPPAVRGVLRDHATRPPGRWPGWWARRCCWCCRGRAGSASWRGSGGAEHLARRARDPRDAIAGLAITVATVPWVAGGLVVAYRVIARFTAGRKAPELVLVVAMIGALAAVAIAVPIAFVLGRLLERALRPAAAHPRLRFVSSPYAPFVGGRAARRRRARAVGDPAVGDRPAAPAARPGDRAARRRARARGVAPGDLPRARARAQARGDPPRRVGRRPVRPARAGARERRVGVGDQGGQRVHRPRRADRARRCGARSTGITTATRGSSAAATATTATRTCIPARPRSPATASIRTASAAIRDPSHGGRRRRSPPCRPRCRATSTSC